MPDLRGLMADPRFRALPPERQQAILARVNPQMGQERPAPSHPLSAWDSITEQLFRVPDRIRAAMGVEGAAADAQAPLSDREREFGRLGMSTAVNYLGGEMGTVGDATRAGVQTARAAASGATGAVRRILGRYPNEVAGAVIAAAPRLLHGDVTGAVEQGAVGALMGRMTRGGPAAAPEAAAGAEAAAVAKMTPAETARRVSELMRAGKTQEARALIEEMRAGKVTVAEPPAAPTAAPSAPSPASTKPRTPPAMSPQERSKLSERAAAKRTADAIRSGNWTPPKPAAPPIDPGKAAAAAHAELVSVAKEAAAANPKIGQKIWIHVKDGRPVGVVTPDQAGAITRAKRPGESATWIKNLWGRAADTFAE